jgi:hypothetical protein
VYHARYSFAGPETAATGRGRGERPNRSDEAEAGVVEALGSPNSTVTVSSHGDVRLEVADPIVDTTRAAVADGRSGGKRCVIL